MTKDEANDDRERKMPQVSHATVHAFVRRVSDNVDRISQSTKLLIGASMIADNGTVDREGAEIILHANQIVTSSEELLKLVSELKLARLMMDWKKQDEHVTTELKHNEEREKQDRDKLKRVSVEVKEIINEIDLHRNESRAKRIRPL